MKKVIKNYLVKAETEEESVIIYNNIILKVALCIFSFVFCISCLSAQGPAKPAPLIGLGFENAAPGNGHGMFHVPNASINSGKNTLIIGLTVQNSGGKLNGIRIGITRNLSGGTNIKENEKDMIDLLQINGFTGFQFNRKASLGRAVIREEDMIRREYSPDAANLKFSTAQISCGVELQVNFSRRVSLKSRAGAGAYYHFNYVKGLEHRQAAPALNLATGIHVIL